MQRFSSEHCLKNITKIKRCLFLSEGWIGTVRKICKLKCHIAKGKTKMIEVKKVSKCRRCNCCMGVNDVKEVIFWSEWNGTTVALCRECREDARRALEEPQKEQEAKQVIRKQCKKEYDDGSIDFFAEWYCPHGNLLILRGFDNPSIKFCYKCGKPVLWENR